MLSCALEQREGTGAAEQVESPYRGRRPGMRIQVQVGREGAESFAGSVLIASFFSMKSEAESLPDSNDGEGGV